MRSGASSKHAIALPPGGRPRRRCASPILRPPEQLPGSGKKLPSPPAALLRTHGQRLPAWLLVTASDVHRAAQLSGEPSEGEPQVNVVYKRDGVCLP